MTSIGSQAFLYCTGLTRIIIPESMVSIGTGVFPAGLFITWYYNPAMTASAFGSRLTTVIVPENITVISDHAFNGCTNLTSITFESASNLQSIGELAFGNCTSLTNIRLPDSVTSIGNQAFSSCANLTNIRLPDSLISIGEWAFINSGLISIVIPSSVMNIGINTFTNCGNLTIYAQAASQPIGWVSGWNGSSRPVIWGVTLSADKTYVVSFTRAATSSISNPGALNGISAPFRQGFIFGGWSATQGGTTPAYTAANINNVPNGTTVYAIWTLIP